MHNLENRIFSYKPEELRIVHWLASIKDLQIIY